MSRTGVEKRIRAATFSLVAWYAQILIAGVLYFVAPPKVFLGYLVGISIWTGIETGHARLNGAKSEEASGPSSDTDTAPGQGST